MTVRVASGSTSGGAVGPSGWDGYVATAVAGTTLKAMRTGNRTTVKLADRPAFYP